MQQNIIKEVFKNTINIVLIDVPDDLKKEFYESYYRYLITRYLKNDLKQQDVESIVNFEIRHWKRADCELKLHRILEDKAYDVISKVSSNAFDLAYKRLKDEQILIDEKTANNYIKILEDNLDKVRSFNVERVKMVVSEGIMDLLYASGQTEDTSLRIGRNR